MDIPFDALLTLLIFLVGIPALILQLISATERRVVNKGGRLDVGSFLIKALLIIVAGLALQFLFLLFLQKRVPEDVRPLVGQIIWLLVFAALFYLAWIISQQIPKQYGRREEIIKTLRKDVLSELKKRKRLNVSGETFEDLVNLGKHCEAGQEREMVLRAFMEIVNAVLADTRYNGDSLEMLIEELTHILAFNPESKDLYNYRMAVDIFSTILAYREPVTSADDKRRCIHAVSHLSRTLILNFKSAERDNVILACLSSFDFVLSNANLLTEISQAMFEMGICALEAGHDFIAVAVLDKIISLAERQSPPLPIEFVADLFGLLADYWAKGGSRRDYARRKFQAAKIFLGKNPSGRLKEAQKHLVRTICFDEADRLGKMHEQGMRKFKRKISV
jgi:hypothetical protein